VLFFINISSAFLDFQTLTFQKHKHCLPKFVRYSFQSFVCQKWIFHYYQGYFIFTPWKTLHSPTKIYNYLIDKPSN
jgi:hypothetical protein